jgi:hypothetical protein
LTVTNQHDFVWNTNADFWCFETAPSFCWAAALLLLLLLLLLLQ